MSSSNNQSNELMEKLLFYGVPYDPDKICSEFLAQCNKKCSSLNLTMDEQESFRLEILDALNMVSMDVIRSLFRSRINENHCTRRNFISDLSQWKESLKRRRALFQEKMDLDQKISSEIERNAKIKQNIAETTDKINTYRMFYAEKVQAEKEKCQEFDERLNQAKLETQKALDDVRNEVETIERELEKLQSDADGLESYFATQESMFTQQLEYKRTEKTLLDIKKSQRLEYMKEKLRQITEKEKRVTDLLKSQREATVHMSDYRANFSSLESSIQMANEYLGMVGTHKKTLSEAKAQLLTSQASLMDEMKEKEGLLNRGIKEYNQKKEQIEKLKELNKEKEAKIRQLQKLRNEIQGSDVQST